jgi:acyl dehydratase
MRFFEDFATGLSEPYGSITVGEAELLRFAAEFDPQPMHLDAHSAQAQLTGGLIASGWYTCSLNMRLMADGFLLAAGSGLGSPGIDRVGWLRPVRPGNTLTGRFKVMGRKASQSRPDRGFVRFLFTLTNEAGEQVLMQENLIMLLRRDPGAIIPPPEGTGLAHPRPEVLALPEGENLPLGRVGEMAPGHALRLGSRTFSAADIVRFAQEFDPQDFHLSEEAGKASHFGGLAASGWHIAAGWMRALLDYWQAEGARGRFVPRLGPSPGIEDLRWIRPVLAGDQLTYASRLIEARKSASRPGWGIARHRHFAVNQRGEVVFAFTGTVLWEADAA